MPARRRRSRRGSWEQQRCPDINDYKWELYNLAEDFSQYNDLSAQNPDKLKEMQALFLVEAEKYQVLPLDNSILPRLLTPRPSAIAGQTDFNYTGANAGIPIGNAPSLLNRNYTITAQITVPDGGAEGMIATMGGRFGGYGLFLQKGKPVFVYNLLDLERFRWEGGIGGRVAEDFFSRALKPGKHTLVFDFKYDGPGPGKGGTGIFTVDGRVVGKKDNPTHNSDAHGNRRVLRYRERYPHGSGRQLRAAVPLHRDHRQADLQTRPVADDGRSATGCFRNDPQSDRLVPRGIREAAVRKGRPPPDNWAARCKRTR